MTLLCAFKKITVTSAIAATAVAMGTAGANALDEQALLKLGEMEFIHSWAACHGVDGRGGGPVAEVLSSKPTDLTQIAKNFGGKFPADFIYEVIDGRKMVNPHGDRQMPVWGPRYYAEAAERAGQVPHDVDVQAMVHGRTTALVQYIGSIQAK